MSDSKVENKRKPGRQPGTKKTGGRKKGTPNKKTVWLRDELNSAGLQWGREFYSAFKAGDKERADMLMALLPYLNPRLKDRDVDDVVTPQDTTKSQSNGLILDIIKTGRGNYTHD